MEKHLEWKRPRIYLRPLTPCDAKSFALLLGGDPRSIAMMDRMPHPCTAPAARDWIAEHSTSECCAFGILRRSDHNFLGAIGLNTETEIPELGYWIGRPYWSHGYATEAVRTMETLAEDLGIACLAAETFPGNRASQRVLAKAGFREMGLFERELAASARRNIVCRFEKALAPPTWA